MRYMLWIIAVLLVLAAVAVHRERARSEEVKSRGYIAPDYTGLR